MPPPALISLAASSRPPENGSTAPILIESADHALVEFVIDAQQINHANETRRIHLASDDMFSSETSITGFFIRSAPCCCAENVWRRRSEVPGEYEYEQSIQSDHKARAGKIDPSRSSGRGS